MFGTGVGMLAESFDLAVVVVGLVVVGWEVEVEVEGREVVER